MEIRRREILPQQCRWPQALDAAADDERGVPLVKPLRVRGGKAMVEQCDEVICLTWAPGSTIEGEDAKAANAVVVRLCRGRRYPLLVNITGTRTVTHAARGLFTSVSSATRIAVVGSSPVDAIIATFCLRRCPPPCPARFFASRAAAMRWLRQPFPGTRSIGKMKGTSAPLDPLPGAPATPKSVRDLQGMRGFAGSWAYLGSRPGLRPLLGQIVGQAQPRVVAVVSGTIEPAGPVIA